MAIITFDLETTGIGPDARIVQIAMKKESGETYCTLVNPCIPIEERAIEVHGITDEMVSKEQPIESIAEEILEFLSGEDTVLSGYNIRRFDIPVLRRELKRVSHELPIYPIIDVFELNKKLNPYSLERCYKLYTNKSMDPEKAHNALYDVDCTIAALAGMVKKHKLQDENLIKYAEPEEMPVCGSSWVVFKDMDIVFSKGKFRHEPIWRIVFSNPGYFNWILKLDDVEPETREMLNFVLDKNILGFSEFVKQYHPDKEEVGYTMAKYYLQYKFSDKVLERAISIADTSPSHAFLAFYYTTKHNHPDANKMLELYDSMEDNTSHAKMRKDFIGEKSNGK